MSEPHNPEPDWSLLPPLRAVIAEHGLRAEKKLGQNFLLDMNVTDKIARAAGGLSDLTLFEIGPGPGGLTRSLLKAGANRLVAIEYDPRAVAALAGLGTFSQGRLRVVQGDALEVDLCALAPQGRRAVVANLPYNIATPLLIGWLAQLRAMPGCYDFLLLMFQREVADRLTAPPGGKAYGRLSVMAQWLCDVSQVYRLPAQAFTPPPKVSSCVVRFVPRRLSPDAPDFAAMERVCAAAFGQRRKMVRSSLQDYAAHFAACGIDPQARAEELAIADFAALASRQSD